MNSLNISPQVSICLPTLNNRPFLEERMDAILAQTVSDWELIVCDSYSDDGTWEYFQRFKDDDRVRLYQVPKEGLYAGWNECLRRAEGKYCYMAPADDTCMPTLLEDMLQPLESSQNIKIAVCDFDTINIDGMVVDVGNARWPRKFYGEWMNVPHIRNGKTEAVIHACLGIVWWTITCVLFRRDLLDQIGYFRTDRGSQADEEWEMRAALASDIAYIPKKLATWRIHEGQFTAKLKGCNRTNLDCFESILDDPESGVPEEWKLIEGWKEKILHICYMEYLDSFNLYGNMARKEPVQFVKSLGIALVNEPRLLLSQLGRGFKWSDKYSPDPIARTKELIDLFDCQWPPTPVKEWEN